MFSNRQGGRQTSSASQQDRWSALRAVLLGMLLAAAISAVLLVDFLPSNRVLLSAGDVSRVEILAPYDLTYESEIRTRQAQEAQAAAVQEIYDPPDAMVARQQEIRAYQILDFIGTVREDDYASAAQKEEWLAAIPDLQLPSATITRSLSLDQEEWLEVREETVRVLARVYVNAEIRESQVDRTRQRVPTLIGHTLSEDQSAVVNGYSDLMVAVFGDKGKHTRAAVGMSGLPGNIATEIGMIVEVQE